MCYSHSFVPPSQLCDQAIQARGPGTVCLIANYLFPQVSDSEGGWWGGGGFGVGVGGAAGAAVGGRGACLRQDLAEGVVSRGVYTTLELCDCHVAIWALLPCCETAQCG